MTVMKQLKSDLPYGTVLGATCSDGKIFFVFTYLCGRCCKNSLSARGPSNNQVSRHNHLFNRNNSPPPRQFLGDKIVLKNKLLGKMFIKQIIEFELRGLGLYVLLQLVVYHVLLQLVVFMTKQKRKIFEWIIIFC